MIDQSYSVSLSSRGQTDTDGSRVSIFPSISLQATDNVHKCLTRHVVCTQEMVVSFYFLSLVVFEFEIICNTRFFSLFDSI